MALPATSWDMEEARELVRGHFGRVQVDRVRPTLQSIHDRLWYAGYHYHEACTLLDTFVASHLAHKPLIVAVFGGDGQSSDDFQLAILKIGAHVLACVQSIHATLDIFAHAVYFCTGMDAWASLAERDVTLRNVVFKLPKEGLLGALRIRLGDLSGENFKHISALSNHGKHRSIIRPSLNEDWTGTAEQRHTLKIPSFVYAEQTYPEVTVNEFLATEHERFAQRVVHAGNALNAYLRSLNR